MTQIRDVLYRDPTDWTIPNLGVAKVGPPQSDEEWRILRYELEVFVAEGEYEAGLERIVSSYLANLDRDSQPAAWISGFFGSGKSHLARVLDALWTDVKFPDGASASGIVNLTPSLAELFAELRTRGRQFGSMFSAAGTLNAGGTSAALSFLSIIYASAGLPANYASARFVLWLRREGLLPAVEASLSGAGKTLSAVLQDLYVSDQLAEAILAARPDFATSKADARKSIQAQYPPVQAIPDETFVEALDEVVRAQGKDGSVPLTLVVLDELQQFVGDDNDRSNEVQQLVEATCAKFGSRVIIAGTGQMALSATRVLQKLQDRFTVGVGLRDSDVDRVVRAVVLRKKPDREVEIRQALDRAAGEISRHLSGSAIAPAVADGADLVADYPFLPSRRRFWDRVLRAMDTAGRSAKLRTQLRIMLDATKEVAGREIGVVVGADAIYDQLREEFLGSGALPRDTATLIDNLNNGTADGSLRCRIAKVAFLISKLPPEGARPAGVIANSDMITDLLVEDLSSDGPRLRAAVPNALGELVKLGVLDDVHGQYIVQTPVAAEWRADEEAHRRDVTADEAWIASERETGIRASLEAALRGIRPTQGETRETRRFRLFYQDDEPRPADDEVPVWVRDGWAATERSVVERARAAGTDSHWVYGFIERPANDELRRALIDMEAAGRTLDRKAPPVTPEGLDARAATQSRRDNAQRLAQAFIEQVVRHSRVYQAGGAEVALPADDPTFAASVARAIESAVLRLYPQFGPANAKNWARVVELAKQGNATPLTAVDHRRETETHDVSKAILAALGPSGTVGQQVRKRLTAPPYGWPQDAIDGCLLALVTAGKVEARQNGTLVSARQIQQNVLGAVEFRRQSIVTTIKQRLAVRSLAQDLHIKLQGQDDLDLPRQILSRMHEIAALAGGDAPLPGKPTVDEIRKLESYAGAGQLVATADAASRLGELRRDWEARATQAEPRMVRWRQAERLLRHAEGLDGASRIGGQLEAVRSGRTLLRDPDPVSPLVTELCDLLRAALAAESSRFLAARDAGLADLMGAPAWQALGDVERQAILEEVKLDHGAAPTIGTTEELLVALDALPIDDWEYRTQAVPAQIGKALQLAAHDPEVPTVQVARRASVIKSSADLDRYLEELRAEVQGHLDSGATVIL